MHILDNKLFLILLQIGFSVLSLKTMTIFIIIVLFLSIVIHEIAHGSMALVLGDYTAKNAGRLSLNPLKHIDIMGTIIVPLLLLLTTFGRGPVFGWAKPVPINPYNFTDQKWGELKVSLAGPAVNFLIGLIFALSIRFFALPDLLLALFGIISLYNFAWGIFNLIPIPPLDGSHILFSFLPASFSEIKNFLYQYGFFIFIFLIFWGGLNWIFSMARTILYFIAG